MKVIVCLQIVMCLLACSTNLTAQTTIEASPEKWTDCNCRVEFAGDSIHMVNTTGSTALVWMEGVTFKNGIVELDIKGKDVRGESFVGLAFHASDNKAYNAIYFRPFNFGDPEKKDRAVQYVQLPENDWDLLREKNPGKYEHRIEPDTDPNAWFHIKVEIHYPVVEVFVNEANEPTLKVEQLNNVQDGLLGLWIDGQKDGLRM